MSKSYGREGLVSGQLKIRVYTTQRGRPAALITLPIEVMEAFGWQPGMYLTYYPTTGRELVLVSQDQHMVHVSPDYDLSLTPKGQPMPKARPGSMHEREIVADREQKGSLDRMLGRTPELGLDEDDTSDLTPAEMAETVAMSAKELKVWREKRDKARAGGKTVGEHYVSKKRNRTKAS